MKNLLLFKWKRAMLCVAVAIWLLPAAQLPAQGYWDQVAQLPQGTNLPSAETVGDLIYVIGGMHSPSMATTEVYAFDPAINMMSPCKVLPKALAATATAVVDGKIYVFGGVNASEGAASYSSYRYDPVTNVWTTLSNMSVSRGYAVAEAIGNKIYVIGGIGSYGAPAYNLVEVYDTQTDSWETAAPMSIARGYMCSVVLNNRIYVMGGSEGQPMYESLPTVEVYEPLSNTWLAAPNLPMSRWGAAAGVIDQTIYIAGGVNSDMFLDLDEMDGYIEEGGWQSYTSMPFAMHGAHIAAYENKLYSFGGSASGAAVKDILVYHPLVGVHNSLPTNAELQQNTPNPFSGYTSINLVLPATAQVDLRVYTAQGSLVQSLVSSELPAGLHTFRFEGNRVPAGVYYYQVWLNGTQQSTRKMLVVPAEQ